MELMQLYVGLLDMARDHSEAEKEVDMTTAALNNVASHSPAAMLRAAYQTYACVFRHLCDDALVWFHVFVICRDGDDVRNDARF